MARRRVPHRCATSPSDAYGPRQRAGTHRGERTAAGWCAAAGKGVVFSSKRAKVPWYSPPGLYEYTYRGVDKRKALLFCVTVTGVCSLAPAACFTHTPA